MEEKVARLIARFHEVENQLGESDVLANQKRYQELVREHSHLRKVKEAHERVDSLLSSRTENRQLLKEESDPEMLEVIKEELALIDAELPKAKEKLELLLVPPDPRDNMDVIVELRAGTGGDEAALFVGDCVRMYHFFAEKIGWKVELISATESEVGGYKEYVMSMRGDNVFRYMRYEGGTHRVQRIPATETQGRIHTSAITVAVLPEPEDLGDVEFDEKDLRIDTFRSSGAGGQHVNTTDSAVRITHIPTGAVASCQQERSQHKNKDQAMRMLVAKIAEEKERKAQAEMASARSAQVGSGDRSERIRTYNFPQNRITDHRIGLTLHSLDRVINGELEPVTSALVKHYHQLKLAEEK